MERDEKVRCGPSGFQGVSVGKDAAHWRCVSAAVYMYFDATHVVRCDGSHVLDTVCMHLDAMAARRVTPPPMLRLAMRGWIGFVPVDTGRAQLFDPFFRAQSGQRAEAALSLTLVKRFVELHGGTVNVTSEEGQGTTITCTFPEPVTE